jgi:hypothetical protein
MGALRRLAGLAALLMLSALLASVWAPTPARAEAACPNGQLRVESRSTSLPDCRAYELVTPPNKNGALINENFLGGGFPAISTDGKRVIAVSIQCFGDPESCRVERKTGGEPYAFDRAAGGWVTHPLAPPSTVETHTQWTVSADAGTALFTFPRVPPGVIEEDFYGRDEHGAFLDVGPVGEHTEEVFRLLYVGSTGDLSHVVYQTRGASVWSFNPSAGSAVYEYTGTGNATPLMVAVTGGFESHELISTCRTILGGEFPMPKENGALSKDGRTVYFAAEGHSENCPLTEKAPAATELYARIDGELPDARSVLISGPTPAACTSEECRKSTTEAAAARGAGFVGASADGSRAFFTDTQQLTDGASEDPNAESTGVTACIARSDNTPGTGGCNLYESECPNGNRCADPAERRLIDLSEGPGGAPVPGGPRVQGVVGISADGSHAYFVAKGVLTGAEENQSHEAAEDGKDNLYAYERDEAHPAGRLAFVATLAPSDQPEWEEGGIANVTPSGRQLVFTSHRGLTPDATCVEGEGVFEVTAPACPAQVFEYDAQTRALVRVSIGENGWGDNGNGGVVGVLIQGHYAGDATVAEPLHGPQSVPLRLDPTMSVDGSYVFFQSPVALTPGALNDVPVGQQQFAENIYEYHEGHVSLISDGKDTTHESFVPGIYPVELLGSDATGANVFFMTFDALVPQDTDTQRDIYDARIEGGVPVSVSPSSCEGEACQGAPAAPPVFGAPSSSTFSGPGNPATSPPAASGSGASSQAAARAKAAKLAKALKACRTKHNRRKRARCEKQARKLYGKASKATKKE